MNWIRADMSMVAEIAGFLDLHPETSMFPAGNLRHYGLDGALPRGVRFWCMVRGGAIVGVVGVTNEGMIFPQAPGAGAAQWHAFACVCPAPLIGCVGDTAQVRACLEALGLAGVPMQLDRDEPRFALSLDQLQVPDGQGQICAMTQADRALFVAWRSAYAVETLGAVAEVAAAAAGAAFEAVLQDDSLRFLRSGSETLSMTSFNARLPGIVQIGGVYTPPLLRGRGHARRLVALHLLQARAAGVARAVLFAANDAAVRAYQAIGFTRTGQFSLALFAGPQVPRHG